MVYLIFYTEKILSTSRRHFDVFPLTQKIKHHHTHKYALDNFGLRLNYYAANSSTKHKFATGMARILRRHFVYFFLCNILQPYDKEFIKNCIIHVIGPTTNWHISVNMVRCKLNFIFIAVTFTLKTIFFSLFNLGNGFHYR